ncbi:MAG: hypothetical protein ACRBBM_11020 [Pseudomonadaceae bacterium]|jgi:hypothetical protein
MTITFLPHTAIDAIAELSPTEEAGRSRLLALRDRALAGGAHVLLLLWPDMQWVVLAVDPPEDVEVSDALQLIPNLMANPDALKKMQQRAQKGNHLQWIKLARPGAKVH